MTNTGKADIPRGEVLVYEAPDGAARVDVRLERDTVWLRQEQMSQLFGRERSVITKHVRNVFREGELDAESVCAKFAHTAADGKTYQVDHFNLDVIISVGYRVKSAHGTRFRQWATGVLRDHLVRGYTINRQRFEHNFVEFLHRNGRLIRNGEAVINDVGLAALALLVAESAPKDKEVMIRLVMNMLAEPAA